MFDQHWLRSACAYTQSDQSLCKSLECSMTVKLLIEHNLEFLSLKGGCTGSSESIHVKMLHCWKSSSFGPPHEILVLITHVQKLHFNPFILNVFSHPYQLDKSVSVLRVVGWYFSFYSNFKGNFCKQTVKILIRRHILQCLIWFCTVCRCPTKRTLGLYGLTFIMVLTVGLEVNLLALLFINIHTLSMQAMMSLVSLCIRAG